MIKEERERGEKEEERGWKEREGRKRKVKER
jgi:hypothetical protein